MTPPDVISISPALIGLVGVLVGAIASLAGTYFLDRRHEVRDRRGLAAALLAELKAILHVEEAHDCRAIYQGTLDRIKRGEAAPMPNIGYETNPARSVYYTNLSRIGTLPDPIPEKIVQLAYVYEVIAADRAAMDQGEWDRQEPSQRIKMLGHHLETYDDLKALAREVALHLKSASR
ncbi:MAG TPA: hypothetical protein ENI68_12955 [Gammaproteobacteria bacterium]|nr:hypothetical protein [Gammaproteobacteria bacterium]